MGVTQTATFLFTDLVGSTALASSLAPADADAVRRAHFEQLRGAVEATGGREVKNLGDGLMVVFTSASRALACAAGMQQAVERANRRTGAALGLRVGLSMGEATEEDGDFFGDPVIEAARLCAAARGGQVLTTEALRAIAGRHAGQTLRSVGTLELKGLPEPVPAVELVWEPSGGGDGPPLPSRLTGTAPEATFGFIGRGTETGQIEQDLKDALGSSQSRLALIGGEPGIGKTSLAAQLARAAHQEGVVVTFGACEEGLGVAFHPWLTAVGHLLEHAPPDTVKGLRPSHVSALRRLLPHLADRLPEAEPISADADAERFLLLDALAALLAAAGESQGLLVVLDDLQWADAASLQVITHLVRSPVPTRALVIGTFRPGDLTTSHPLTALLADLRGEPRVRRCDLAGLADDEVIGLIEAAAGHRLDAGAVDMAHLMRRDTGGNPFFIVEVLRHLAESGAIVQDATGRYALRDELSELALPPSVRDVVGRRLRRLGDDAVRALSFASVIGQEFDLDLLAAVSEIGEDRLLDLLDAAAAASLLTELDDPPGRYRFSHALVQSTLYAELSPARRQRAHQKVAERLEEAAPDGEAASLARHLLAAIRPADVDKAVAYARQAGDQALAALAPVDAARWYTRALDALERAGGANTSRRAGLLVALARAQAYAGDQTYKQTLRGATSDVLAAGDVDILVQAALVRTPGSISSPSDPDPHQVELIERALDAVGTGDSPTRARLLAALADEYGLAESSLAARRATEAMEMAERLGDPDVIVAVYIECAAASQPPDRAQQRRAWAARVEPLIFGPGNVSARVFALNHLVENAVQDDLDWAQFDRLVSEMERWADAVDLDLYRWEPQLFRAWQAITRGSLDEGDRLAHRALETGLRADLPPAFASYGAQLMMHRLFSGRLDEILSETEVVDPPMASLAIGWRLSVVWLHCLNGSLDQAERLFSLYAPDPADIPLDVVWLQSMAQLGESAVHLGRTRVVEQAYERLLPYADRFFFSGAHDTGYIARPLGRMAAFVGRVEAAEQHLRLALDKHRQKGLPYWQARSALDLAEVVGGRDPDGARSLVEEAARLAAEHGFGGLPLPAEGRD